MNTQWTNYGFRKVVAAVNASDLDGIATTLNDSMVNWHGTPTPGEVFTGAIEAVLTITDRARAAGLVNFSGGQGADMNDVNGFILRLNTALHRKEWTEVQGLVQCAVDTLAQVMQKTNLRVALTPPRNNAPQPMPVTVVSLPDRMTESSVTRNDKGEIVSTHQFETDA